MVGDEPEVSVWGDEREHFLLFPSLESDAGVERDIVQHSGIDKRQTQVGHASQSD